MPYEILKSNYASEIGHPCLRYLVWRRKKPIIIPDEKKKLFDVGKIFEEVVLQKISSRFLINETQKKFYDEKLDLSGVVDAIVNNVLVLEIKSVSSGEFKKINWISLYKSAKFSLYVYQIQAYFLLSGFQEGLIFFINRESGDERIFEIKKDEALIEEIIEKCIKVNEYLKAGKEPEGIFVYDICKDCYYFGECKEKVVGKEYLTTKEIKLSADLLEKLDRYYVLQEQLQELKKLEEEIKEILREFDNGIYLIPERDYYISVKEFKRKVLELPEEVKKELEKKYTVQKPYKMIKIKSKKEGYDG